MKDGSGCLVFVVICAIFIIPAEIAVKEGSGFKVALGAVGAGIFLIWCLFPPDKK